MHTLPDGRVPVLLSAHAEELLAADAQALLRYLDRTPDVLAVAATLLRTRRQRRHRAVVRAADAAELTNGLRALAAGDDHPLLARSSESRSLRTTFVFPGQGSQWPSMGAGAYRQLPIYRSAVDKCAAAFIAAGVESPLPYLTSKGDFSQLQTQAAQFTHAVGLAHVWRSCGIAPDITLGHSLGEVAAAYIAQTITLADAAAIVIARATVIDGLPGHYGMAVLGISADEAERLIATTAGWLELSVVNASSSVVVSGDRDAISAIVTGIADKGMFAREIAVDFPAHTSALEHLREDLLGRLPRSRFIDTPVQFIGSATASVVTPDTDFADYWYRNLRHTVRFDRAVPVALERGAGSFVELSAHPALLFALGDLVGDNPGDPPLTVGSGLRDEPLVDALSANIVAAAVNDPGYRWADLVDVEQPPLHGFPNAPMRAIHLWATPEPLPPMPGLTVARETWEPKEQSVRLTARRISVIDLAGPTGPLSELLRTAVELHDTAQPADPHEADMVVAIAPVLDHPDAESAAQEISELIGAGLLDYVATVGHQCRDVWLITVGGEHVRPDEPVALPAQAALAAMHRSIGFEYPDQTFRHLDLPSWEVDPSTAAAVIDTLCVDVTEAALRDTTSAPTLYVRSCVDSSAPAKPWRLDDGVLDNVVITGGSGTVGLHYARYVAERGARRIVLLSRGGVDPPATTELASLHGAEVLAPRCDITSTDELRATAYEHAGDGASLVIHAAGSATFAVREEMAPAAFADTAAAKVTGLARIAECWPLRSTARIVVCSSISGVWGGRGHAAYSAANRMLDVMAGQLRAKDQRCVAVRFGLWGTGIVDADEVARIERSGLLPMAPDAAIEASLHDYPGDPLVMAADRDRLHMFFTSQAHSGETDAKTSTSDIDIAGRVRAELAAALNLGDAATVDLGTSLLDLGVDSLLALDLRKRLRRATGRSIPLATLLGGVTGGELIASLDTPDPSEKVETSRD